MAIIKVQPAQLRSAAQVLMQKAKTIKAALETVDKQMSELNSMRFVGNRATALHTRFSGINLQLLTASFLITTFAKELETAAVIFENADKEKIGVVKPLPFKDRLVIENNNSKDNPTQNGTHSYPVPPITHKLNPVNPGDSKYTCATYAAARRPDLGSTQSDHEEFTDQAAANYISKYKDSAFQVNGDTDLTNAIGKGYAVVWKPGVGGANKTYGHVAIVEEVGKDYVVVSEAGWSTGTTRRIPIDKLDDLWLIP